MSQAYYTAKAIRRPKRVKKESTHFSQAGYQKAVARLAKSTQERSYKRSASIDSLRNAVNALYTVAEEIKLQDKGKKSGRAGRRSAAEKRIYKGTTPSGDARFPGWTAIPRKNFGERYMMDSEYVPLAFHGEIKSRQDCASVNKLGQFTNSYLRGIGANPFNYFVRENIQPGDGSREGSRDAMRRVAAQWASLGDGGKIDYARDLYNKDQTFRDAVDARRERNGGKGRSIVDFI